MSDDSNLKTDNFEDNKLVRPKLEFQLLLQHAGATKEVFTLKEVMFYLGQYIMEKQLYDKRQQHIVHCSQDALGRVLGVDSFSVKEPRVLFAMIIKNLVAVQTDSPPNFTEQHSQSDRGTEDADSESRSSSPKRRRRRRSRRGSGDPGPSHCVEEESEEDEEEEEGRKRRRSDSFSLTFDNSLSWCVIGGLGSGRDRQSSQSPDAHSTSGRSVVTAAATHTDSESDSDHFSVEFEVESVDSDDYDDEEASLSGEDQVYEVTIFEANADHSSDEDTEITAADYWRCVRCEELNPPLPRNCNRCWALRRDWLPEDDKTSPAPSSPKALPLKPTDQSAATEVAGSDEEDGVDVPDGKRLSQCDSQDLLPCSSSSAPDTIPNSPTPSASQCSQELLPSSPSSLSPDPVAPPLQRSMSAPLPSLAPPPAVELERHVSLPAESRLPDSSLDPCLICQTRPKNGCIVHGGTGHLMCCYTCARKLKRRNKLCPVCRLPIQSVVLTYLS